MKKHIYLVINNHAGSGNAKQIADKIINQLHMAHIPSTVHYTEYAGHEEEIVHTLASTVLLPWDNSIDYEPFPLLVVLGGDGTLHNVLNALNYFNPAIPIGYVPCGTGNDFARGVGISTQSLKAFAQLVKATQPQQIRVIHYNESIRELDGLATNNIGVGIDGAVVNRTNNSIIKRQLNNFRLGTFSYACIVLKALLTKKSFPIVVEMNGKEISFDHALLCTVTNHPYFGGGIPIVPTATINKESIDLVVVENIHLLKIFWLIFLVFQKKQLSSKYFHHFQSKKIRIISTIPQYIHADGEVLGKQSADIRFWTESRHFWF